MQESETKVAKLEELVEQLQEKVEDGNKLIIQNMVLNPKP